MRETPVFYAGPKDYKHLSLISDVGSQIYKTIDG